MIKFLIKFSEQQKYEKIKIPENPLKSRLPSIFIFSREQGMRESNSHQRFWRPLSYHLTNPLYPYVILLPQVLIQYINLKTVCQEKNEND